jgi:hypothetical protein
MAASGKKSSSNLKGGHASEGLIYRQKPVSWPILSKDALFGMFDISDMSFA